MFPFFHRILGEDRMDSQSLLLRWVRLCSLAPVSIRRWWVLSAIASISAWSIVTLPSWVWAFEPSTDLPNQTLQSGTTKNGFFQNLAPGNSAQQLGPSVSTNYDVYCQPTYPPAEKNVCLLGLGDKLPEGEELETGTDDTEPQTELAVTEFSPLLDPLPYQYDKVLLFPLR